MRFVARAADCSSRKTSATMHPMIRTITESDESAYVLSSDLRILHTSKGWRTFALQNGGAEVLRRWPTGARIDAAWPPVLRGFYRDALASALAKGERWDHEYECSSPTEYRKFRMCVYPIEGARLAVVNSLVVAATHACDEPAPDPDEVYDVDGFVTMCSHCRRTSNPRTLRWDWVPAYVETLPANASHGLCPTCFEFYYPDLEPLLEAS